MNCARYDESLLPYKNHIDLRMANYANKKVSLLQGTSLCDFANGSAYFGFHKTRNGWYYREWAPGAQEMYLTGDFCGWDRRAYPMKKKKNGVFELFIRGSKTLQNGMAVMTIVIHDGQELERIPLYARRVVQDPQTAGWHAEIYDAPDFPWTDADFVPEKALFIYECHIGMAQEEGTVGTYDQFRLNILPRIKALGYNTLQIMAIMEHPYYASFGYQVTNFFAPSSRFGTPESLKRLIDTAHSMGIAVLLDVVHSHASANTREGLNEFDGTPYQFFHAGPKGDHSAWGTKCFDYDKNEVLHFLLSNLKYWLTEYHFDGFRFDGVTSMLYHDHGLGSTFGSEESYFSMNTDLTASTYLQLACELTKQINPNAILIAEDTSALPGLCLPIERGGIGFDYRLAMGEPDMWIRLLKEIPDDYWDMGNLYYEMSVRRPREKVIGYCESHDQALVGDKTIAFRLCDQEMYWHMDKNSQSLVIDRGIALHKMLRLLTMSLGGNGYLTFMGNEFGHPEWIDFPREGNGWSYHYCRRQWHLADDPNLRYHYLQDFDRDMVKLGKKEKLLEHTDRQLYVHNDDKILAFQKGNTVLIFNFHPANSYTAYPIPMGKKGKYKVIFSSDDLCYGGQGRIFHQRYETNENQAIPLYLPSRTAMVLKKCR